MSAGLFALLDDVAVLARAAAASVDDVAAAAGRASAKAAGVIVDDTAVTPRYVQGLAAKRELPIIKRIAIGSLRNKLLFILPAAMLLSQYLDWALTPILMAGGTFLCYEGVEKIWEKLSGHEKEEVAQLTEQDPEQEEQIVSNAVRTDFILSAEIMVISLNEVADEPFLSRLVILIVVAVLITVLVYGVVGLIVKMDDIGLSMAQGKSKLGQSVGKGLVAGMPKLLAFLSIVGVAAMIWVGGHILLVGMNDLGFHPPYEFVHHLEENIKEAVSGIGGALAWLANTVASALIGLVAGAIVVAIMHVIPKRKKSDHAEAAAH